MKDGWEITTELQDGRELLLMGAIELMAAYRSTIRLTPSEAAEPAKVALDAVARLLAQRAQKQVANGWRSAASRPQPNPNTAPFILWAVGT
jgi:hypothetical protein